MSRSVVRIAARPLLLGLVLSAWFSPCAANTLGLSSSDVTWMRNHNLTLVAPATPRGFTCQRAALDRLHSAYKISCASRTGGALVFEGTTQIQNAPAPASQNRHGILAGISNAFNNLVGKHSAQQQQQQQSNGLSNEEEVDPREMDVSAYSRVIGAVHFVPASNNCARGQSEKGIPPATYIVTACNVHPDTIVHFYSSAQIQH